MTRRVWLVALMILAAGCSKKTTAPPPPPPTGSIAVSPGAAIVLVHDSRSLTATVSNSAATAVTWRLVREPGLADTVDVGSIVSTGPLAATYTAPARVLTPGFDYTVTVLAVATTDTTLVGTATIFVPRVRITVNPGSVASVPPGTWVPYRVKVENAANKGFALFVEGIPGGDAGVGTWVATTETTAVYKAPVHDTLFTYSLFARTLEDPDRFATSTAVVRAGFPLPDPEPTRDEFVPEWNPVDDRLAFVRGGPSWDLVVYDFSMQAEQVVASFSWTGSAYDGRVAWSDDGSRIAFSEVSSGRRVIGLVSDNGTGRTSFGPDASVDYHAACFLPGRSDSLYDTERAASGRWSVRAHATADSPADTGRVLHLLASGVTAGPPDADQPVSGRPLVGYDTWSGGLGSVISVADNDNHATTTATAIAGVRLSQVRWAMFADNFIWLTYVSDDVDNLFRVQRSGLSSAQRLYVDFFPESAGDLKPDPPLSFHFVDAHAVSRIEPDGHARIWIIGAPPSSVVPVSRALEIELRRIGLWSAFQPRDWRVRRLTP